MYLFHYPYNLIEFSDIIKIKKLSKLKKINILDFGCGNGSWNQKKIDEEINSLCLYDKNKDLIFLLKKKYNSKKISIEFNNSKIFKKNVNLIIFSSVIQYMNDNELNNIFSKIIKIYKNKKICVFINDHPLKNRIIELFCLLFFNLDRFFYSISLVFRPKYLMTKYYFHNIYEKKYIVNNFEIKKIGFSKKMKNLRGKFVLVLR